MNYKPPSVASSQQWGRQKQADLCDFKARGSRYRVPRQPGYTERSEPISKIKNKLKDKCTSVSAHTHTHTSYSLKEV